MKKLFFILCIALLCCKSNFTKIGDKKANYIPYYLKVYEADSLFLTKNYSQTYEKLDSLFNKYEPINMVLYFEYENYIKSGLLSKKKKSFRKEYKNLFLKFGHKYSDVLSDSILKKGLVNTFVSERKAEKWHHVYISNLDTVFRNKINSMNFEDQKVRNAKPLNWKMIERIDLVNDSVLRNYIQKNGYPNFKNIGTFRKLHVTEKSKSIGLDVLINHFTSYENSANFYGLVLPKFVKNGTCPPKDYGDFMDRYYNKFKNTSYFYFITDDFNFKWNKDLVKEINSRRRKNGLPSIEYHELWFNERIMKM
jgi:hypothetical protein